MVVKKQLLAAVTALLAVSCGDRVVEDESSCGDLPRDSVCCQSDMVFDSPVCADGEWICQEGELNGADCGPLESCQPAETIASTPSSQQVTLTITNASDSTRWLATNGNGCDAVSVFAVNDDQTKRRLNRALGFWCPCECSEPQASFVEVYRRLEPGEQFDMQWNATQLITYSSPVQCSESGMCSQETLGYHTPVEPGRYSLGVVVRDEVPSDCVASDDGLDCYFLEPDVSNNDAVSQQCEGELTHVEFELPAEGDVTVEHEIWEL